MFIFTYKCYITEIFFIWYLLPIYLFIYFKLIQTKTFPIIIESPKDFNNSLRYFWVIILLSQNYFLGCVLLISIRWLFLNHNYFWNGLGLGFGFQVCLDLDLDLDLVLLFQLDLDLDLGFNKAWIWTWTEFFKWIWIMDLDL